MILFYILILIIYNYAIYFLSLLLIESKFKMILLAFMHFIFVTFVGFLYSKFILIDPPIEIPIIIVCMYFSIFPIFFILANLHSQNMINKFNNLKKNRVIDLNKKKELLKVFTIIVALIQLLLLLKY